MIEAMKQALKALGKCRYRSLADEIVDPAITALRTAIAEAEKQEPVAWDVFELRLYGAPLEKQHRVLWVDRYTHPDGSTPDLDGLLEAAKKDGGIDGGAKTLYVRPLYTTPPAAQREPAPGYCKHCKQYTIEEPLPAAQRTWVGLTPTDMKELSAEWWEPNENEMALINWIEAKLKEKNT